MKMIRVLITGGAGQLAQSFKKFLEREAEVLTLSKGKLNIMNLSSVLEVVSSFKPNLIINCAAYNLVDKAEEDFDTAFSVNTLGVSNLAFVARKQGSFLIHFSTDYVFDGTKGEPYVETDKPTPINKYGQTKWLGEIALQNILPERSLIFRVSWVYGFGKQNFLSKLRSWSEKKNILQISCDEFSVPTYTETIVYFAYKAYQKGLIGLYHLVNNGFCSRYEWAKTFVELMGSSVKVYPVRAEIFSLPAKRPFFSALSPAKLERELGETLPHWREDLKRFVSRAKEAGF